MSDDKLNLEEENKEVESIEIEKIPEVVEEKKELTSEEQATKDLKEKQLRVYASSKLFKGGANIPGNNKVGVTRKVKAKKPNKNAVIKHRHKKTAKEKKATKKK